MSKRVWVLAAVIVVLAPACSTSTPSPVLGAGKRFVPQVVDAISDVGVSPTMMLDAKGNPAITYLGYNSIPAPGAIPEQRPVTLPQVPAVLYATGQDGAWSVNGVVTMDDGLTRTQGDNQVPLEYAAASGAIDASGTLHVVWIDKEGLEYGAGGIGQQFSQATVAKGTNIRAPSLALDAKGNPWVSFYDGNAVEVAAKQGGAWRTMGTFSARNCGDNCPIARTSLVVGKAGPIVAFAGDNTHGGEVATYRRNGWTTSTLPSGGGFAISLAVDASGKPTASYLGPKGALIVANPHAGGLQWTPTQVAQVKLVADDTLTTSLAIDGAGVRYLAWYDPATDQVLLASDAGGQFATISTPGTQGGAAPSVAVTPDGKSVWLAWYDQKNGNLQAGAYADSSVVLAKASPPASAPAPPPPPSGPTTAPTTQPSSPAGGGGGKAVTLQLAAPPGAAGTGFDKTKLSAPANTPLEIAFNNADPGVPHNVQLFQGSDASGTQVMSGDIITGPAKATYVVPALAPGTYFYRCEVHPTTMTGTLTVK